MCHAGIWRGAISGFLPDCRDGFIPDKLCGPAAQLEGRPQPGSVGGCVCLLCCHGHSVSRYTYTPANVKAITMRTEQHQYAALSSKSRRG